MTTHFITRLDYIPEIPSNCINCNRDDDLVDDILLAFVGENEIETKTVLCKVCETLMIISSEKKGILNLKGIGNGDTVKIRSSPEK